MALRLGREILYLSRDDVLRVGPSMAETIELVRGAFQEKGAGLTQLPPKTALHPLNEDAFLHAMPAYVPGSRAVGMKWVSGYPDNPAKGLPYITGLLILNDPDSGVPIAVMDCSWITAQRTGAVSGLAAGVLARTGSQELALLGAGVQGRTQLEAMVVALPELQEVRVYDVHPDAADRFVEEMAAKAPGARLAVVASPERAVHGADVVVTAGPILKQPSPVVQGAWLKEGALGLPVDFDSMWTEGALHAERYYVDDLAQYRYYQGQGFFGGAPAPSGDLGDLLTGRIASRQTDAERIVSMNLGVAIADMPYARVAYERALEKGVGAVLPL